MRLPYANMAMRHMNPGASKPLIMPVQVVCNVPEELIFDNIRENSRNAPRDKWVDRVAEHDGVAVLCGSGPSLVDFIDHIAKRKKEGAKIFAMNGAAGFLVDHGILPDYQVLIDAREETAALIGPAKEHLFASQVHPECFKRMPTARLWHLQIDEIDDLLPDDSGDLLLIGGSASVGNTATCLAYAMGYRELQIYGYDSCHRNGKSHAFHQSLNDGDPYCEVSYDGKVYTASLTMKLQAEQFQITSRHLMDAGCKIEVHGDGLLPEMFRRKHEPISEEEKYRRMWESDLYRIFSPGEGNVDRFLSMIGSGLIIDFGCGTGRAAFKMAQAGRDVVLVDFADNCRDEIVKGLPFICQNLNDPLPIFADYGFCTDVMEHIPTLEVESVIQNIMLAVGTCFFQISTVGDTCGKLIGEYLHLTVRPSDWWVALFKRCGYEIKWQEEDSDAVRLLVSNKSN